jgi:hypothetical protein
MGFKVVLLMILGQKVVSGRSAPRKNENNKPSL